MKKDNSFDKMLAEEQRKVQNGVHTVKKTSEGADVFLHQKAMGYYNNKAMTAYFYMTYSTTDFKG